MIWNRTNVIQSVRGPFPEGSLLEPIFFEDVDQTPAVKLQIRKLAVRKNEAGCLNCLHLQVEGQIMCVRALAKLKRKIFILALA